MNLKPCPFCGRIPKLHVYKGTARINCSCGASVHSWFGRTTEESEQEVRLVWNRRTKRSLWKTFVSLFRKKEDKAHAEE